MWKDTRAGQCGQLEMQVGGQMAPLQKIMTPGFAVVSSAGHGMAIFTQ